MRTVSSIELVKDLPRFLAEVEAGEEFVITRGSSPLARLSPIVADRKRLRPKVGQTLGPVFEIPDAALKPLSAAELEPWGL